jgi:hypothetical protein
LTFRPLLPNFLLLPLLCKILHFQSINIPLAKNNIIDIFSHNVMT